MITPYEVLVNMLVCLGIRQFFELLEDSVGMTNVHILLTSSVLWVSCWIFGLVHHFLRFVSLVTSSNYWFHLLKPVGLQLRPLVALFFMVVNFLIFATLRAYCKSVGSILAQFVW